MIGIGGYPAIANNTGLRQRRVAGVVVDTGGGTDHDDGDDNRRVGGIVIDVGRHTESDNNNNNGRLEALPRPPAGGVAAQAHAQPVQQLAQQQQQPPWRTSHVYCFVSALLAILAIITTASSPDANRTNFNGSKLLEAPSGGGSSSSSISANGITVGKEGSGSGVELSTVPTISALTGDAELITTNPVPSSYMIDALDTDWWRSAMDFVFFNPAGHLPSWMLDASSSRAAASAKQQQQQQSPQPWSWKKLPFLVNLNKQDTPAPQKLQQKQPQVIAAWWHHWLDPSLLQAKTSTITDLIDKVLTSTPRLLAIANLLLALTYQMHTAVADWFLGVGVYPPPGEWAMTGRERLGSFLVFKLLLISAVVAPDTLDLLILLSWYTLLSFLRSLAHLASATTSHTTQSGQPPRTGVLQLLLVVLLCDFVAAAVCVALFQLAGVGMVILLTCDCALLAVEVLGHILKHVRQVLEDMHEHTIAEMEEQQLEIHTRQRRLEEQQQQQQQQQQQASADTDPSTVNSTTNNNNGDATDNSNATDNSSTAIQHPPRAEEGWGTLDDLILDDDDADADDADADDGIRTLHRNNQHLLMEDSRRLDQTMDVLEMAHTRRMAILDTTIFILQLVVHAITVGHFLHIWTLHGIQFTLIDGVLALHLHSALSAASKQIAERRNLHRIARTLDGMFPNASQLDLEKAHACGDVCCICLGAISVGSVKKVGCGHLYHTNCLREVIERAHSMEAAKCPLCRASVVDGSHPGTNGSPNDPDHVNARPAGENDNNGNNGGNNNNNGGNNPDIAPRMVRPNDGINHRGERALFRFSTEGILPTWMPLPAFSFEVVRRPTRPEPLAVAADNGVNNQGGRVGRRGGGGGVQNPGGGGGGGGGGGQQSFFRRLLLLAGAVPMSPEEEARALAQLVDMFPQYDRADLLRELRDRGSAESVVESVLLGIFSGRVRGSAGGEVMPATANNLAAAENQALGDGRAEDTAAPNDTLSQQQADVNNTTAEPPAREVPAQI